MSEDGGVSQAAGLKLRCFVILLLDVSRERGREDGWMLMQSVV